ncbi:M50 family metallopeptidase [Agromyces seonyuensis]|uniref:M50 family metallopeptidase n=1 Tax=Agromyces seonyuensis TaxID=2662446 RepID=UPI00301559E1
MNPVLAFIIGVLVVAFGVAVSIGLHEAGHFTTAKLFKVKVTQFMIGFGPTVFSRRKGETEYGLKALPLGGYVSMIGMFPPKPGERVHADSTGFFGGMVQDARDQSAETIGPGEDDRAFYRLPVWKRIIVMFAGPFMNLVIAIALFAVLIMGIGTVQSSTTIASVSECVLPATSERQTCEAGDPAAPGAEAGIQPGDEIVSIDGVPVTSWEQSTALIRDRAGETVPLVVDRDGEQVTLQVTPAASERYVLDDDGRIVTDDAGEPVTAEVGFLGIGSQPVRVQGTAGEVLPAVGEQLGASVNALLTLPQKLVDVAQAAFGTEERDPNGPVSVVGVGRIAGEIAASDQLEFQDRAAGIVGILASLNLFLFLFNLVPLMPLDGGHIAGAIWEAIRKGWAKLRGKPDPGPVDMAKLMPLSFAVVIVFGAMSALLIYADLVKPVQVF